LPRGRGGRLAVRVAVLGAGQMGTAFGAPLLERGHEVVFWGPHWIDAPRLEAIASGGPHPDLGVPLPVARVETEAEIEDAVEAADLCVLAVVSEGAGWVSERAAAALPEGAPVAVLTKGLIERESGVSPVTSVVQGAFGAGHPVVGFGGPVKAAELVRKAPTRTVLTSARASHAAEVAREIETPYYFPAITEDLVGAGICAALKNCYAIAVNLLAGRSGSANLRSLAFSAALEEMFALVTAAGGRPETVAGPAGSGDLYVTCLSGRNGDFGRLLGEGYSPEEARKEMEYATVEGLDTLPAALRLTGALGLEEKAPVLGYLDEVLRLGGVEDGGPPVSRFVAEAV